MPLPSGDRLKGIFSKLITIAVVLLAGATSITLYRRTAERPWTRDAQLRADTVQIAPRVSGYLVEINVKDNQAVKQGDLLFKIDPSVYQLAVEQAEVGLIQARQEVEQLEATVRSSQATVKEREAAAESAKQQIDAAKAGIDSSIAAIAESESEVESAKAKIEQVEAQLTEAEREATRAEKLADSKAGSVQTAEAKRSSVDAYTAEVKSAKAGLTQSQASLEKTKSAKSESDIQLLIAEQGYVEAQAALATANANLDQAKASLGESGEANYRIRSAQVALQQAQLDLDWTSIYAPADGYITNMKLLGSTFVSPGTPFALFVDGASFRVDAYFQETKLKHLAAGDKVVVTLMGHRDHPLAGSVESIGFAINPPNLADTDGPNNLVPSIEPTFEWIRLAQRVPVRIRLDDIPKGLHLVSGMTASVATDR